MSVARQCALLGLPRSSFYYEPLPISAENLRLMRLLDRSGNGLSGWLAVSEVSFAGACSRGS